MSHPKSYKDSGNDMVVILLEGRILKHKHLIHTPIYIIKYGVSYGFRVLKFTQDAIYIVSIVCVYQTYSTTSTQLISKTQLLKVAHR